MKTYVIHYNIDGYSSPLPERKMTIRAKTPNNALAKAVQIISYRDGVCRGAIVDAKREGGRVYIGKASYSRNKWAWVNPI